MLLRCYAIGVVLVFSCCSPGSAQYENCTSGVVNQTADGSCDGANNSPECNYDGGDCCLCTCVDNVSCTFGVDCVDPGAGNEFYYCEVQPSAIPLCSSDVDQNWEVNDTAQALALAQATNCSGGSFHVTWRGNISMDATIYVVDGTVLHLNGVGTDAVISGRLDQRLITVVNASLVLKEVSLNYGYALVGGAIAASASRLILNHTSFTGNQAGSMGGALYVVDGSSVTFYGDKTMFSNNGAVRSGGAIYAAGASVISWKEKKTFFTDNISQLDGGAIYIISESIASWTGEVRFSNNICGRYGGAVFSASHASVAWDGAVHFSNNTAGEWGGAALINDYSNITGNAEMTFYHNSAGGAAGGLYVRYFSTFSWAGRTRFEGNRGGTVGGAIVVATSSYASGSGDMLFSQNRADEAGAVIVAYESTVSWGGNTNFSSNVAENAGGGAIFIFESSHAIWGGTSIFVNNNALDGVGGAVVVYTGSTASWASKTTFTGNSAGGGGALYVAINCTVSCEQNTTFDGNAAISSNVFSTNKTVYAGSTAPSYAGAVFVGLNSTISWSGETTFSSNTAETLGGGLMLHTTSSALWGEKATFVNNSAPDGLGGAVAAFESSNASWMYDVTFTNNSAGSGGALYVARDCTVCYGGDAKFEGNIASSKDGGDFIALFSSGSWTSSSRGRTALWLGGAVYAGLNSTISWKGLAIFSYNTAEDGGGALALDQNSNALWTGKTTFSNNISPDSGVGGALFVVKNSSASWTSDANFTINSARTGGALYVDVDCIISYNGITTFDGNSASGGQGGALSVSSSNVYWKNKTIFVDNKAQSFGGAVSFMAEISSSDGGSLLVLAGPTVFLNNTCETNGGAVGLIGDVVVTLETIDITFSGNRAAVAGGAIYIWGNDLGLEFIGVKFLFNHAQLGGGVHSTGSGNALIGLDGEQRSNPVVFNGCIFYDNHAIATGGAIQSAAGQDVVVNTTFVGNTAVEGGALNLAGTALLVNCSFEENLSDEGGGPIISNIGYISGISNCSFLRNAYSCEPDTFLDYNSTGSVFDALCKGCEVPCQGCLFDRPPKVPFCVETMENTHSPGGLTTLEYLLIEPGYWRATTSGQDVLPCYNADACLGGLTGATDFCLDGYEGPYCAICSQGYWSSWSFTCNKCSNSIGGIVLGIVLLSAVVVAMILIVIYLLSAELEGGARNACIKALVRCIPVQSIKVVIVVWQIVTQFVSVANVQYPHVYQVFLDGVDLFDFDIGWMLSASCLFDYDFHDRLLFTTVGPIVIMVLLGITYKTAEHRSRQSLASLRHVQHKHLSAVLLLTFFVYANVSSILFQTFSCEHLENGKFYLRADYRIECDSTKHVALQVYAGFMVMLYTLGIPFFYATLLFRNRDILRKDETSRDNCAHVRPTSSLWKPYKPAMFYFELIECARRALLAGVVVFFQPNTASQIAVTLILAFAFALISGTLDPYVSKWDTWLSRTGHVVVFVSVYIALLLRVDVSTERHDSQHAFEIVLVLSNGCMVAAVVIEACVMTCSLECFSGRGRENDVLPDNQPRYRSMRWLIRRAV